jgi:hypothetical protein
LDPHTNQSEEIRTMKTTITATLLTLSLGLSAAASAKDQTIEVEITNLTNGTYFTPLLITAHDADYHLFRLGTPSSDHLRAMAEGGNLAGLIADLQDAGWSYVENPAGGVLEPGGTTSASLEVGKQARHLSVTAMLVPTNDGFVGLDGIPIPRHPGVYTYYLNGYDAGTEGNDEVITGGGAPGVPGIPGDPGGNSGTGGTGVVGADYNQMVHVHPGVAGDLDPLGGPSDLDSGVHRWLNPVARVTVTVGKPHKN